MRPFRHLHRTGVRKALERVLARLRGRAARLSRPPEILFSVDQPGPEPFETAGVVSVSGWAVARSGVEAVDISIDGTFVRRAECGLPRPDVAAAHPAFVEAGRSGFSESIDTADLQSGDHTLRVDIRDRTGRLASVERGFRRVRSDLHYHRYYLATLPTRDEADEVKAVLRESGFAPLFEWWLQAGNLDRLERTLESIASQSSGNWRCFVVAPAQQWEAVRALLSKVADSGPEERFSCREEIAPEPGREGAVEFVGLIAEGAELAPHALLRWALELQRSGAGLSYADSDLIKPGGLHCQPNFKPDWSPDHALSRDYVGGVFLTEKSDDTCDLMRSLARRSAPAWRYDLWLRLAERIASVHHVREVLWSAPFRERIDRRAAEGELRAVRAALARRGSEARVEAVDDGSIRRIRWPVPEPAPLVSIVIPTTGRLELVRTCVESLVSTTDYQPYELVFVDNSRGKHPRGIAYLRERGVKIVEHSEEFNWASLCNLGAAAASGELLLFFNDDMEVIEPAWLDELVAQAMRPEIGAAGALLLYPDGRIQHGGVFLVDHGGGARHCLQFLHPEKEIYQSLQRVAREVSANTGACLMTKRSLFEELGGFDEELAVVGNDVDLCLRIGARGYRSIWTPFARVVHHESVSRRDLAIDRDEGKMWERWEEKLLDKDPFYNPNLTQTDSNCELNWSLAKRDLGRQRDEREDADEEPVPGVNLIGYIRAEMGVGEAARSIARALAAARVPFGIINYEQGNPSRMGDDSWAHRIIERPRHPVNILHVNADLTPDAVARLPKEYFAGRQTIGYWVWELPEFPDEWLESFRHVDEVWVPSSFVREAVSRKSPVPVARIPHSIEKPPIPHLGRAFFGLAESRFLFLVMYDLHSIRQRKNPEGAIRAFREAFAPREADAGLVIKVNNASQDELRRLREAVADYPTIEILDSPMSRYEVDSLIHSCDCFVSLHRSEGFGLAIAEAMALGRPVIATAWSGNCDFMRAGNAACVGYELEFLGRDYGPYTAGQRWAEPDLGEAARWMRRLVAEPDLARELGERARADVEAELSPERVGRLIRSRLARLRR